MKRLWIILMLLCALLCGCSRSQQLPSFETLPEEEVMVQLPDVEEAQTVTEETEGETFEEEPVIEETVAEEPVEQTDGGTGKLQVHFLDVGQADCIYLTCEGENMLIDGGNVEDSDLLVAYLMEQGVTKLDYVVNTHAHEDHVGGLPAALAVFETSNVWCPVKEYTSDCFADFCKYADQQGLELVCPEAGSEYSLGSAVVQILGPVKQYDETNDTSIVLRVEHGENSFLFTGDAETPAEADILDAGFDVTSTVLKVGHHGSSTSTGYRWLREVMPMYAVIQVGAGNSYGHPNEEVLARLSDAEVKVMRTDELGHIVCTSDGVDLVFEANRQVVEDTDEPLPSENQPSEQQYIGNINSKKLHVPSCASLPKEKNRVYFEDLAQAQAEGYTPCGNCMG